MSVQRRQVARGQALSEAVLGVLVCVTVLIFGIHFAEVGFLALKVQEAANFGLWDATAYKMHDTFTPNWSLWKSAIPQASNAMNARYDNVTSVTYVFTAGDALQGSCQEERGAAAPPNLTTRRVSRLDQAGVYPTEASRMSCTAQAKVHGVRIPRSFLDSGSRGFFKERHWRPRDIWICAAGRATGPRCQGKYAILLDDWGFSGPQEKQQCLLLDGPGCANTGYYNMVDKVFQAGGAGAGNAAMNLASFVSGISPSNPNNFYMSFAGSESPYGTFTDSISTSHHDVFWETTPFTYSSGGYSTSYSLRTQCFLGASCN